MSLDLFTGRTLRGVFDSFTSKDGEFGLDRFKEAILDFEGVTSIGQAFADEIFRVFQSEHPGVHITWVNANEEVSSMIGRVRSDSGRS